MFCKLAGARKRGFNTATTMHSTTSSTNVPSSFFILSLSSPRLNFCAPTATHSFSGEADPQDCERIGRKRKGEVARRHGELLLNGRDLRRRIQTVLGL